MQFNILLNILFELLQRQKLTATYLARKHDLSTRTVYRYVEKLSECVPLQVKRGRDGGIFLSECYKLPLNFMTEIEYASAQEALSIAYEQYGEARFLQAKKKLSTQEKTETKTLFCAEETGSLFIDSSGWDGLNVFTEKLRLIKHCMQERYVLEIEYLSPRNERSLRKIEPHALIFQKNAWHVYAFCHKKRSFRSFSLGKIVTAVQTGEHFLKRSFEKESIFSSPAATKTVNVRLEVAKSALSAMQDWLGVESLRQQGDKWYAEAVLADEEALLSKLLSFGAGITVVEPLSLREKISKEVKKTMALYT